MSQLTTNTASLRNVLDKVNALEPPRPAGTVETVTATLEFTAWGDSGRPIDISYFAEDLTVKYLSIYREEAPVSVSVVKNSIVWASGSVATTTGTLLYYGSAGSRTILASEDFIFSAN